VQALSTYMRSQHDLCLCPVRACVLACTTHQQCVLTQAARIRTRTEALGQARCKLARHFRPLTGTHARPAGTGARCGPRQGLHGAQGDQGSAGARGGQRQWMQLQTQVLPVLPSAAAIQAGGGCTSSRGKFPHILQQPTHRTPPCSTRASRRRSSARCTR